MQVTHMEWKRLEKMSREIGDGFYLLDLGRFAGNYHRLLSQFRQWYPKTSIGYSYKTNYTPVLCRWIDGQGGYAEVVSGMEYEHARHLGVLPGRIIFNGPYKTGPELREALCAGTLVNLDNESELQACIDVARQGTPGELRVGLRCNLAWEGAGVSRFGFDVASGALACAVERLADVGVNVTALHCHISTGDRSVASYRMRTRRMLETSKALFGPSGPPILDMGGGFFSPMSPQLRVQFEVEIPSFKDYAEAVAGEVAAVYGSSAAGPELVVEPGAALVADAASFVAKVLDRKRVRNREVILVAGSVHNIKPTLHRKNMPVRIVRGPTRPWVLASAADLVGYTCMEHDCLHTGFAGEIGPGDFAVFENVGAYTVVMQPPFIQPAPAMVLVREDGGLELARCRQTYAGLFEGFSFDGKPWGVEG